MCGICGDLRFDGSEASAEAISAMMRVMIPRGPDGGGMLVRRRSCHHCLDLDAVE